MKLHELDLKSQKAKKRIGRGISSGSGKTAGRGTKGQNSRSGGGVRPGFEGGQNPLMERLPKMRGFKSHRKKVHTLSTDSLNRLKGTITHQSLFEEGMIPSVDSKVKLVAGKQPLKKGLKIQLSDASKGAVDKVKKAGGTLEVVKHTKK